MEGSNTQDIRQFLSFRKMNLSCSKALLEMSSEYHRLLFNHPKRIKGNNIKSTEVFNEKFSESLIPKLNSEFPNWCMVKDSLLEEINNNYSPIYTLIINEKFQNNRQIFSSLTSSFESSFEAYMHFLLQLYIQEKYNEFTFKTCR